MNPTIEPIEGPTLGAVITGIDLNRLGGQAWRAVEDAFLEYAVLVFPAQHLGAGAQVAFGKRFGAIELLREDGIEAPLFSNKKLDGTLLQPDDFRFKVLSGNEGWHMDSTYMPLSAKAGLLSAVEVPASGGETEFADMRAAYDALDEEMKARIEDLSAHHSLYQSQAKIGYTMETGAGYGFHTKGAPLRPLVKPHPVTGRKALFIGRHAYSIPGFDRAEAKALLDELVDFACRAPRTYAHSWKPGDVVIWDNRCVLHRVRPYDYAEPRSMRHTRIAGDPKSELVVTGRDERAADFVPSASNN